MLWVCFVPGVMLAWGQQMCFYRRGQRGEGFGFADPVPPCSRKAGSVEVSGRGHGLVEVYGQNGHRVSAPVPTSRSLCGQGHGDLDRGRG